MTGMVSLQLGAWSLVLRVCASAFTSCTRWNAVTDSIDLSCCLCAGVLYASKETHYSVFKAGKMYRMPTEAVDTLPTGEIDYEHFRMRLRANQDKPAIVNVNIGTTVKGAVDDLDRVLEVLTEEGFDEDRFYIHCDGALFGLMVSHTALHHPMADSRDWQHSHTCQDALLYAHWLMHSTAIMVQQSVM